MIGERLCFYICFFKSHRGKIQTEKNSAFQLAEERRKDRGFGLSDGWTVGPVSPRGVGLIQILLLLLLQPECKYLVH